MAGEQEQSNAGDQEQRNLEVIKLRIAFLQHIATLSGAAIVIILALVQRAETTWRAFLIATTIALFVQAALVAVTGVWWLITHTEEYASNVRASAGRFTTALASASFSAGIVIVAVAATGIPLQWFLNLIIIYFVLVLSGFLAFLLWLKLSRNRGAQQAPTRGTEGEDKSEGRG